MLWVRRYVECEQVDLPSADLTVALLRLPDRSVTYLASEPVRQASRSKRARDASHTFFFLLHNKVWL